VWPDVQAAPQDLYALRFMALSSMEEGRMLKAQELLEEINRLMQNLQTLQGQFGGGGGGKAKAVASNGWKIWPIISANSRVYRAKPSVNCKTSAKVRMVVLAMGQRNQGMTDPLPS
jgi:hypothetical protein